MTKRKKSKKAEPKLLFVEVKEPSGTRRDVLMATKDVLDALKRYEQYRDIQVEKHNTVVAFNREMGHVLSLNRKLRGFMPKAPVKMPSDVDSVREEEEKEVLTGLAPLARPKSKLDDLQEELEKIESRLAALE